MSPRRRAFEGPIWARTRHGKPETTVTFSLLHPRILIDRTSFSPGPQPTSRKPRQTFFHASDHAVHFPWLKTSKVFVRLSVRCVCVSVDDQVIAINHLQYHKTQFPRASITTTAVPIATQQLHRRTLPGLLFIAPQDRWMATSAEAGLLPSSRFQSAERRAPTSAGQPLRLL